MKKTTRYVCSECGHTATGWTGRCPACGAWGTMTEFHVEEEAASLVSGAGLQRFGGKNTTSGVASEAKAKEAPSLSRAERRKQQGGRALSSVPLRSKPMQDVVYSEQERWKTNIAELDRVLGGGIVRDSLTMLTARPGAGKSTLLLQVAGSLAAQGQTCLYISGEESEGQVRARADRVLPKLPDSLYLLSTVSMDVVVEECQRLHPVLLIADSVQTLALEELTQRPGSPTQTVRVTETLVALCKNPDHPMACFVVGHMTKSDEMAGLRTLEHLVDAVLYLEDEKQETLRLLRATKNRFGATGEVGVFQMEEQGLMAVDDPFDLFLTRRKQPTPGAAVGMQAEGTRLIPLEVEALVSHSYAAYPVRIGDSLPRDTINTLVSILEQKAGLSFADRNVVIKATGGLRIHEKACDLAVLAAIASSYYEKPIPEKTAFLGEVGLTGELKRVARLSQRVQELLRLGFKKIIVPESLSRRKESLGEASSQVCAVSNLREAFSAIWGRERTKEKR